MKQRIASLLICTVFAAACASAPQVGSPAKPANIKDWIAGQSRARRSAIAGAIAGAVLGAVVAGASGRSGDDVVRAAAALAVVGAIAGFAVGNHEDHLFAGRDLAVRDAAYDATQGYVAKIAEVRFEPPQPKPGHTATLIVRYIVVGPNVREAIHVRMFRGLKYGEDYVFGAGPNDFVVQNGGGIVESKVDVTLPKKAPLGTYSIEALVEDAKGRFPQVIGSSPVYIVATAAARRAVPAS
jgi:VanZ family protein